MNYQAMSACLRSSLVRFLLGFFALVLFAGAVSAYQNNATRSARDQRWVQDVEYIRKQLPAVHKSAFHSVSRAKFEAALDQLVRNVPKFEDHKIIVEISRILALVGDGHTRLSLFPEFWDPNYDLLKFHRFPLRLKLFSDGLFVTDAAPEYAHVLGGKVLKVGGRPVREALLSVEKLISRDNSAGVKPFQPTYLVIPEVLSYLNLTKNTDSAVYTVKIANGRLQDIKVKAVPQSSSVGWISVRTVVGAPLPISDQNPREYYWYKYDPENRLLFVQINACVNKDGMPMADVLDEALNVANSNKVDRLVVDLRRNVGGNAGLMRPFIERISKDRQLKKKLFVLIGNSTFSAALWNALDFQNQTDAIFVGEPTGGRPNHYGESREFPLPNSKLVISYSSEYYECSGKKDDKRLWLAPDLKAEPKSIDFIRGIDVALSAVLSSRSSSQATSEIEGERHLANIKQLTFGGENAEAYFSFDGKRLIFQSKRDGRNCDQIYSMNLDGSGVRMISNGEGRTTCGYFLKDGKRLVYASTFMGDRQCPAPLLPSETYVWQIDPNYEVYSADLSGKNIKPLTKTPGYDAEATVSPDGKRIVFTSERDGDLDIYSMDTDGRNVKRLTSELGYDGGPFYSPDSKMIVYRSSHPKTPEEIKTYKDLLSQHKVVPTTFNIWVMAEDGTQKRQVTKLASGSFAPFFTPDGKRIIFCTNYFATDPRKRNFDLAIINIDGTGLERITFNDTFDGFPMFSPDGKKLVFASNRNASKPGETNVFIVDWVN